MKLRIKLRINFKEYEGQHSKIYDIITQLCPIGSSVSGHRQIILQCRPNGKFYPTPSLCTMDADYYKVDQQTESV
jgi:hypothetical protein